MGSPLQMSGGIPGLADLQQKLVQQARSSLFGFIGPTYTSQSAAADGERCVNLYLESIESGHGVNAAYLCSAPGKQLLATVPDAPIRCIFLEPDSGRVFAVCGQALYELLPTTQNKIGNIPATQSAANIVSNGKQLFISNGNGYIFDLTANTLSPITADGFSGSSVGGYLDGYFIAVTPGSAQFNLSALYDGTQWSGLDFALVEGGSGAITGMVVDHKLVWFFKEGLIEVWYDAGAQDFPYQPIPGAVIEQGCASGQSIAQLDNSIFWLNYNNRGEGIVWRSNGWVPVRVSNHAIENMIRQWPQVHDVVAFAKEDNGHTFYQMYSPSGNQTLVYDCATAQWHEKTSVINGVEQADRALCHCWCYGQHVVGDRLNGNFYKESLDVYTDNGVNIRRWRSAPHINTEMRNTFFHRLELRMQTGIIPDSVLQQWESDIANGLRKDLFPHISLQVSNDGGNHWGNEHIISAGPIGNGLYRVIWRLLGAARDRCYRVIYTEPTQCFFIDAYSRATVGNS